MGAEGTETDSGCYMTGKRERKGLGWSRVYPVGSGGRTGFSPSPFIRREETISAVAFPTILSPRFRGKFLDD